MAADGMDGVSEIPPPSYAQGDLGLAMEAYSTQINEVDSISQSFTSSFAGWLHGIDLASSDLNSLN